MTDRLNPHSLACKKLARTALIRSGVNRKTLADAISRDEATLSRYLSDEHDHEMGISSLLMFEALTGDRTVLDYLEGELGRHVQEVGA